MSSVEMMIRCLLIEEMIISDIDKKRKLGFLLSMFTKALFYSINIEKSMSRVILNEIISLKNQQKNFVIEDEEGVFFREKGKYGKLRFCCVAEEIPAKKH